MAQDRLEMLIRQALRAHGMDPDSEENAREIERVLRIMRGNVETPACPLCSKLPVMVIGDTALCGNMDCKTVFWDRTKTMDELLMNMSMVDLRKAVTGEDE